MRPIIAALFEECELVLGWWVFGVVTATEVVEWADFCLDSISESPDWLMELSIKGPADFTKSPAVDAPRAKFLNYPQKFRLLVETTDAQSDAEVRAFVDWIAREAMGEDRDLPEVRLGYEIDHALSFQNSGDPHRIARYGLLQFRPSCTDLQRWRSERRPDR